MYHSNEIVPIVFASNNKYAPYLGVAIFSLISHASAERQYRIYVLTNDMDMHHKTRIKAMERENIGIEFIDVREYMRSFDIPTINHLSAETAYRLLIDQLFPEYQKMLYLDCDLVINCDVALLYNENVDHVILGVSRANIMKVALPYITEDLKVLPENYFNAGVLVINIDMFRKYEVGAQGLQMLTERRYFCQDQDVLNILCQGKVKFLNGRWNVEWEYLVGKGQEMYVDKVRESYRDYLKDPWIVHYTSPVKPWSHPENMLAEYFWRYARKTAFYEEIIKMNFKTEEKQDFFERFLFPWSCVSPGSNIILYGGGEVGKTFIKQIEKTKYCTILAVCDTYPEKVKGITLPLVAADEIYQFPYDCIVVAIEKKETANQIIAGLKKQGIKEDLIFWKSPVIT